MKAVVAPDSFKECLDAPEVASTLAGVIRCRFPEWEVVECPLSDGGEGFASILTDALGGSRVPVTVSGPLGEPVDAFFGKVGDLGIVDAASACGLALVPAGKRNPLLTTTRGVGELLVAACRGGCRRLIVGLGGSSTCDGGEGMLSVDGIRDLPVPIEVLCDVRNPFVGSDGAARVFGPQKGADPAMVEVLERRMQGRAEAIRRETGIDVSSIPGAGAAGGLAGAMMACLGARLVPGIDTLLDLLRFDRLVADADLVITGEGRSDRQTLSGKVPSGVLRRSAGHPVYLLSGQVQDADLLRAAGFSHVMAVTPPGQPLPEALKPETARENLRRLVERLAATFPSSSNPQTNRI